VTVPVANAVIKQLARILVPLDHSTEPRFLHDPALPRTPIPALSMANQLASLPPEKVKFAQTELTRKQNQVVDALRSAERLVRASLI
jgi:N-acetylated-alpha-linked acidic dipeptidase